MDSTIKINKDNVQISGEGESTTMVADGVIAFGINNQTQVSVYGLEFDASADSDQKGFNITDCKRIRIENCTFIGNPSSSYNTEGINDSGSNELIIVGNTFRSFGHNAIFTGADSVTSNSVIANNTFIVPDEGGIDGIDLNNDYNILIADNAFTSPSTNNNPRAVTPENGCEKIFVVGNNCETNLGIRFTDTTDSVIANNAAWINVGTNCKKIVVANNRAQDSITIQGTRIVVKGNWIKGNGALEVSGTTVIVTGNIGVEGVHILYLNGATRVHAEGNLFHSANWSGYVVGIEDSTYCTVKDNYIFGLNDTGSTTSYGIEEIGTSDNNIIKGNDVRGVRPPTGDRISLVGADSIAENNDGYITENSGTSTQSGDGTTTVFTIAHGLDETPTIANVWAESADANGDFYVSNKDGSNIEITYASAPASGTNNLTWGFEARVVA